MILRNSYAKLNRLSCRYLAFIVFLIICLTFWRRRYLAHQSPRAPIEYLPISPETSQQKVILFWNSFFGVDMIQSQGYNELLATCPLKSCFLTTDRRYLKQSAAVVFHGEKLETDDIPLYRHPDQLYVFFLVEAPWKNKELRSEPWLNFFNLTWTHRLDSDIFSRLYVRQYSPILWTDRKTGKANLEKRKNRALALISNCQHAPSNRDGYIRELQKYFLVDVVGSCGNITCPRFTGGCEDLYREYKFYLAFENSLCRDYMSEKAFRPFTRESLPVFLGSNNYSRFFPPHSFLDAAHYGTPKKLAKKLQHLTENFDEYEKYFEWKYQPEYLEMPEEFRNERSDVCKLCEILRQDGSRKIFDKYSDLHEWWVTEAQCYTPFYSGSTGKSVLWFVQLIAFFVFLITDSVI